MSADQNVSAFDMIAESRRRHPKAEEFIDAHERGGWDVGTVLPFHQPNCYGCGPDNAAGFGLEVVAEDGQSVSCATVFDERFQGAPGVAHGGAVAAVFDDVLGFVLTRVLVPAVTRDLNVTYHKPVRLHVPTTLSARLDEQDGRRLHLSGELIQNDMVVADCTAVFIEVPIERLISAGMHEGADDVE